MNGFGLVDIYQVDIDRISQPIHRESGLENPAADVNSGTNIFVANRQYISNLNYYTVASICADQYAHKARGYDEGTGAPKIVSSPSLTFDFPTDAEHTILYPGDAYMPNGRTLTAVRVESFLIRGGYTYPQNTSLDVYGVIPNGRCCLVFPDSLAASKNLSEDDMNSYYSYQLLPLFRLNNAKLETTYVVYMGMFYLSESEFKQQYPGKKAWHVPFRGFWTPQTSR
jgi:hypothetical protein